jgi:DNA-binding MarR family transcriptional regulator
MMTEKTKRLLLDQGIALFDRMFMKYEVLQKKPLDLGKAGKLHAAQIHMIQAIGEGRGETVTALSGFFMITKGAVSQIVTKLCGDGYIRRTRKKGNDKEIPLQLTAKGWNAFRRHQAYDQSAVRDIRRIGRRYSEREIRSFLNFLADIDRVFGRYAAKRG